MVKRSVERMPFIKIGDHRLLKMEDGDHTWVCYECYYYVTYPDDLDDDVLRLLERYAHGEAFSIPCPGDRDVSQSTSYDAETGEFHLDITLEQPDVLQSIDANITVNSHE